MNKAGSHPKRSRRTCSCPSPQSQEDAVILSELGVPTNRSSFVGVKKRSEVEGPAFLHKIDQHH